MLSELECLFGSARSVVFIFSPERHPISVPNVGGRISSLQLPGCVRNVAFCFIGANPASVAQVAVAEEP